MSSLSFCFDSPQLYLFQWHLLGFSPLTRTFDMVASDAVRAVTCLHLSHPLGLRASTVVPPGCADLARRRAGGAVRGQLEPCQARSSRRPALGQHSQDDVPLSRAIQGHPEVHGREGQRVSAGQLQNRGRLVLYADLVSPGRTSSFLHNVPNVAAGVPLPVASVSLKSSTDTFGCDKETTVRTVAMTVSVLKWYHFPPLSVLRKCLHFALICSV